MSRKAIFITFPIILLIGAYFLGPEPEEPKWSTTMPVVPQAAIALENYINTNEHKHQLKPDNEARIIWADSTKKKTKYSVVYLHGYSASQAEGDPIHKQFAKEFGCNLFLSRLADHGIDTTEQLLYFTPDRWWESSKEALAIGKAIGDNVIVMSTSTGGTSALVLAADFPQDVFALISMSPNIAINDPMAWMANNPWGLQIARIVKGGDYNVIKATPGENNKVIEQYWNRNYRLESIPQLEEMLESKMNQSTFSKVVAPSLTLYYYKNEQEQDQQVKVSAILQMEKELGTPDSLKEAIAIPGAGAHVMGSYLVSKDLPAISAAARKFAIEKLHMNPVE